MVVERVRDGVLQVLPHDDLQMACCGLEARHGIESFGVSSGNWLAASFDA